MTPTIKAQSISKPVYRNLRGYALDPSLAQTLQTARISEMVFRIPWEDLAPGPAGEYLEVIDYDPSARCFYQPVNLDDPYILAEDGLQPSEGTPQFHQQMVYAVSRLTIQNFERALGRVALWAPGPPPAGANKKDDSHFVQRLRIYPHALREANAYYSPPKKALLLGYFSTPEGEASADHMPGSMVFTALSHDVIAHETAHALLDGMNRRLGQPTNQDMLAFHEAFADVVALFQHFTFPEIMKHEMARTRGEIDRQQSSLAELAGQFGRATGSHGALRDFIGTFKDNKWTPRPVSPLDIEKETEPHARGAILVAAVFDAFISMYRSRVQDLLRLYTSGTGVLPAGEIHPDLVNRLSEEATKAAGHVLTMCIRALDYCPPVDLTFGEYLRAIITADYEQYPEDAHNYRVAFVEAFRRRGIYPRDVRTLSAENLRWRDPSDDPKKPSQTLIDYLKDLRKFADAHLYADARKDLFETERGTRAVIHEWLDNHFATHDDGSQDATFLGIDPKNSFQVHSVHFARHTGPYGEPIVHLIAQIIQETTIPKGDTSDDSIGFSGGCAVIADLKTARFSYCVRKPVDSGTRRQRQQAFRMSWENSSLRATYFTPADDREVREPFAILHRDQP
jgi:hypothetical protein